MIGQKLLRTFFARWLVKLPKPYIVSSKDFYTKKLIKKYTSQKAMTQLIKRYLLSHKEILSIGAGAALEEYWFLNNEDNKCTFIDIDESNSLLPRLEKLQGKALQLDHFLNKNNNSMQFLEYYICDFLDLIKRGLKKKFDVLYYSGFTPDELRRLSIMEEFIVEREKNKENEEIVENKENEEIVDLNWPASALPLHPALESSLYFIKKRGLFILQSYCSGIELQYNPSYIKNLKKQLRRNGFYLLDIYNFIVAPGVNLFVAYKGTHKEASNFYSQISKNEITHFHGRAQVDNAAVKFYSFDQKEENK